MLGVLNMPLFVREKSKAAEKQVKSARRQVDLAVEEMTRILDAVEQQTIEAKEELDDR